MSSRIRVSCQIGMCGLAGLRTLRGRSLEPSAGAGVGVLDRHVGHAESRCAGSGLATFLDLGGLAAQVAQVVELRAPHVTAGDDLDLVEDRRVQREGALDADAEGDLADGEGPADARRRGSRITTPWKTWMRERVPSTTFTWTLMLSPARKSGMSSRFWALPSSAITLLICCSSRVPQVSRGIGWVVLCCCRSSTASRRPGRRRGSPLWQGPDADAPKRVRSRPSTTGPRTESATAVPGAPNPAQRSLRGGAAWSGSPRAAAPRDRCGPGSRPSCTSGCCRRCGPR